MHLWCVMERTEQRLVTRAIRGDAAAVEALWAQHRRWVGAVLLAHMPRAASLDDLLQDVAVVLVERVSGLRDPAALRPWLRSVAVNAARTSARRAAARPVEAPLADEPAPSVPQDRRDAETRDTLEHVLTLARDLPPDLREPLLLRSLRGLSQADIAETLGLPETTIETRLARARRQLRERMAARGHDGLPGRARGAAARTVNTTRTNLPTGARP